MNSKSHIFMANLLRDAMIPNGKVTIDGTVYRVPREMVEAIGLYPNFIRYLKSLESPFDLLSFPFLSFKNAMCTQ